MSGSCTYAGEHTAEDSGIKFYGILKREKQSNDLLAIWESKVQVSRERILVPRVLRRYSRKEQAKDSGLHQAPARRRLARATVNDVRERRRPV